MSLDYLDLDLDVFVGPFDLLLTLILREEVDLMEVDLADIVISYIDHLERRGDLDLEAATEFLVLIAALLELKSRLMLPGEEIEELELEPGEAAEELIVRLLAAHRYRTAAAYLRSRLEREEGYRFRSAPLPTELRKAPLRDAGVVYDPGQLAGAITTLLEVPPPVDVRHLTVLRSLLSRGRFTFTDAVGEADRVTVAVTLYALLELYKQGEATWEQAEPFSEITISGCAPSTAAAPPSRTDARRLSA
jgi:segregation and condensation protein A